MWADTEQTEYSYFHTRVWFFIIANFISFEVFTVGEKLLSIWLSIPVIHTFMFIWQMQKGICHYFLLYAFLNNYRLNIRFHTITLLNNLCIVINMECNLD